MSGHAIEARIYAEDPAKNFLPSIGLLRHLRQPAASAHVRVDSGVRQGDEVSMHYDPMIAKLIVWDQDRSRAIRRLQQALAEFQVYGVTANVGFLAAVAAHPAFAAADIDTSFIDCHAADLFPEPGKASDRVLALACLDVLLRRGAEAAASAAVSADPGSPWHRTDGWRLNSDNHHGLVFFDGGERVTVTAHYRPDGFLLELPHGQLLVCGSIDDNGDLCADLGGVRSRATVLRRGLELTVISGGHSHILLLEDSGAQSTEQEGGGGRLTAPMPGKIVALLVSAGQQVERGDALVILEAMKMEHTITAPAAGKVVSLPFKVGDIVNDGVDLLVFEVLEEVE